jgi:hypothetical protein
MKMKKVASNSLPQNAAPSTRKHTLPPPIEIAKLAALLDPKACRGPRANDVLRKAVGLVAAATWTLEYFEELPDLKRMEQKVSWMVDFGFKDTLINDMVAANKLRLYREFRADDLVKKHLKDQCAWLEIKTTRSVLELIEKYFANSANIHNGKHAEAISALEEQHEKMARERNTTVERLRNGMGIPDNERWRDAKYNYEDFLSKAQVPQPYADDKGELIKPKVEYWQIDKDFLDALVVWRRYLKSLKGTLKVPWKTLRALSRDELWSRGNNRGR